MLSRKNYKHLKRGASKLSCVSSGLKTNTCIYVSLGAGGGRGESHSTVGNQ